MTAHCNASETQRFHCCVLETIRKMRFFRVQVQHFGTADKHISQPLWLRRKGQIAQYLCLTAPGVTCKTVPSENCGDSTEIWAKRPQRWRCSVLSDEVQDMKNCFEQPQTAPATPPEPAGCSVSSNVRGLRCSPTAPYIVKGDGSKPFKAAAAA